LKSDFPPIVAAFCTLSLIALSPAQAAPVHKQPDGLTVTLAHGALRVEALAPDVIRVRYSANGNFPPQRVPVLIAHDPPAPFRVIENAGTVTLATGGLRGMVDRKTGTLRFIDETGRTVLLESPGGRSLTPITLPGPTSVASYRAEDRFAVAPGEAIYGLGQHQGGLLDYRGASVILEQANRDVGIPFLVSSRGYGLLWNVAAHTQVDVCCHAKAIPANALLDDNGQPGGLSAHYFEGTNFEKDIIAGKDPKIDFMWDNTPPPGLPHDNYSVRWTGFVQAGKTGDYTFQTASDDGVRLWIDGKPVIDNWTVHPVTVDEGKVTFKAGTRHAIRLEYFQAGGGASIRLSWVKPLSSPAVNWMSEAADTIDYIVFYGPSLDKVIAEYRHATGEAR
jgi:alpha-D-xyloside xylohydrolase